MTFRIINRLPTAEEYNNLRRSVEWPTYEHAVAEVGLKHSLYCVIAEDEQGSVAGMGRILGDNAIYLHLQDIIVNPRFQKMGVGRLIMDALLQYVGSVGQKNTNVGLMSSKGREGFYRQFGFEERPSEKFGSGMIKIMS